MNSTLHRVYSIPPQVALEPVDATVSVTGVLVQDPTPDVTPVLEAQINALREVVELLRQQLDDVKEDRDEWRGQAHGPASPGK